MNIDGALGEKMFFKYESLKELEPRLATFREERERRAWPFVK